MKICFLAQRRFAYIAHCLAITLKEKYGITEFCGYTSLRTSHDFLTNQKEIKYSALIFDEEIHERYKTELLDLAYLNWLERAYGIPNLWPYIAIDRVVMFNQLVREYPYAAPPYTHEEMMRILQVRAKAIIEFLDKEKPDALVFSVLGGMGGYLLHEIAAKKGIQPIAILPGYTKNKTIISKRYDRFTEVEEIAKQIIAAGDVARRCQKASDFLRNFRNAPHPYYDGVDIKKLAVKRASHFNFLKPKNFVRFIKVYSKELYDYTAKMDRNDYTYINPLYSLYDRLKRKIRNLIGVEDLYDAFNPDVDFAYYTLQMEPEISTLLHAPFHANQLVLVRQIARSLPVHFTLYVKEHPQMVPFRPRSYYKELKKIPNVKLLAPSITSFEILPKAKLVLTITSTAGWEALFLGKPVITFGDQFYNAISMVKKCEQIDLLPYIVEDQLRRFNFDEKELLAYIQGMLEDAAPLDLSYIWEHEADLEKKRAVLEPLADLLAKKIKLYAEKNI
ncbi:hypothetical protein A2661_00450 [Candidatus Giovannonibacteria bacterium RIFCSPHIGHO2_01_FULL_45_24]|uniref:Capsule polysaccharide biosynthesis protein n=1 Tax=Candidatus Giovannonibacteria bacterium RIFCSPLOWO2_01_FULL_46_32 TaxID=1798353 RepID=A0A1F5XGP8_9BACT|nr:MAG: hypothetical protein A2661_00450 [Candidatus Giovannonibacteria bacterium RIFCSPHIGHO2_01_FULL_45_24]OGF87047.1 MAG: hypothetical protein A3B19_01290 [Candidatus Giovannonibacteria bacterium RIFCSPLOWO2_01_FULL_46_32]